jgi:hypothetical protein
MSTTPIVPTPSLESGEAPASHDFSSIDGHVQHQPPVAPTPLPPGLQPAKPVKHDFTGIQGHIQHVASELANVTSAGILPAFEKTPRGKEIEQQLEEQVGTPEGRLNLAVGMVQPGPIGVEDGFWSAAENVVHTKLGNKFTPEQLHATLKNAGVPKQELENLKLDDLGIEPGHMNKPRESLTKQEVLNHITQNKLRVQVTEKGDTGASFEEKQRQLRDERARLLVERQQLVRDPKQFTDNKSYEANLTHYDPNAPITSTSPRAKIDPTSRLAAVYSRLDEISAEQSDIEDSSHPDATKYEQYTLPGGSNYREVLLQKAGETGLRSDEPSRDEFEERRRRVEGEDYMSPHFDEPNILAHLRLKDRVDANGKKTLFVEEAQSDWAHDAAEEPARLRDQPEPGTEDWSRPNAVPSFPLGNQWHELALKYALKDAVDKGYDQIAWTTGQQQAERYNLAKAVDHLAYSPKTESSQVPFGGKMGGSLVGFKDGKQVFRNHDVGPKELANYVGKDVAARLLSSPLENVKGPAVTQEFGDFAQAHQLDVKDVQVGGQHHKALYDEMIPQFLNKYTRKWGGQVGTTQIESGYIGPEGKKYMDYGNIVPSGKGIERNVETVHTLPITPEIREAVKSGQPLFGQHHFTPKKSPDAASIVKSASPDYLYKGELVKGSGIHQIEHKNHQGKTTTVTEPFNTQDVHTAIKGVLDRFGVDPNVPETARQYIERKKGPIQDFSPVAGHEVRETAEEAWKRELFEAAKKAPDFTGLGPGGGIGADVEEPVSVGRQSETKAEEPTNVGRQTEASKEPGTKVSVPTEQTAGAANDKIIKAAGAVPGGIEKGDPEADVPDMVLFHDPQTGSTLYLPKDEVTEGAVKVELANSRKKFAEAEAKKRQK